jgi:hypothetical protein
MLRRIFQKVLSLELFKEEFTIPVYFRKFKKKQLSSLDNMSQKKCLHKENEQDAKNVLVKDRKAHYYCSKCFKFLCLEHDNILCNECLNGNDFHL